jgi:hypothetical protein
MKETQKSYVGTNDRFKVTRIAGGPDGILGTNVGA